MQPYQNSSLPLARESSNSYYERKQRKKKREREKPKRTQRFEVMIPHSLFLYLSPSIFLALEMLLCVFKSKSPCSQLCFLYLNSKMQTNFAVGTFFFFFWSEIITLKAKQPNKTAGNSTGNQFRPNSWTLQYTQPTQR